MQKRRAGILAVALSGAGVAVLVLVAAVRWEDIIVGYHVGRLQREPRYLLELIEKPEGTIERKAVRAFVAGAEARMRPFWVYMTEIAIDPESSPAVRDAALGALEESLGGRVEGSRREASRGPAPRITAAARTRGGGSSSKGRAASR